MTYLEYVAGAAALVCTLREATRTPNMPGIARHQLRLDRAIVGPDADTGPDAIVPELLGEGLVWDVGARNQIVNYVDGGEHTYVATVSDENLNAAPG